MNEDPGISVVIPTYNRGTAVVRPLRALTTQTLPPTDYEVIVVVDGSEDGTREAVESFPAPYPLRAIWQPNRSRAAACNTGARAARGRLLVLLDDDMEPAPEFLQAHEAAHAESGLRGVIGAAPVALDGSASLAAAYIKDRFDHHLAMLARPGARIGVRDVYTGNFSLRRKVFLDVGGFDESFTVYGHEDTELGLRLVWAGIDLVFSREASAAQRYLKDFSALAEDNVQKGETAVVFALKHPDAWTALRLGTFDDASRLWRPVRAVLLAAVRVAPRVRPLVVRTAEALARRFPSRRDLFCTPALDLCYWSGVQRALRERGRTMELVHHRPPSPTPAADA